MRVDGTPGNVYLRWSSGKLQFVNKSDESVIFTVDPINNRTEQDETTVTEFNVSRIHLPTGEVLASADEINALGTTAQVFFGDGADGDHVTVGDETITRDMCYDNLTVAAGHTFTTNGFIVRVRDTLTIAATGVIQVSTPVTGGDGVGRDTPGVAGGATITNTVRSQHAGAGGNDGGLATNAGSAGVAGTALYTPVGGDAGVAGGAGGAGGTGGAGGAGGAAGANTASLAAGNVALQYPSIAIQGTDIRLLARAGTNGGGGGGGGGADGGGAGGEGGSGGGSGSNAGAVVIFARTLAGTGEIQAIGGPGGAGAAGANGVGGDADGGGGGGGGAGGNGGLIYLASLYGGSTITTDVSGGAAGAGAPGGLPAGTGDAGIAGSNGTAGRDGIVYRFQV